MRLCGRTRRQEPKLVPSLEPKLVLSLGPVRELSPGPVRDLSLGPPLVRAPQQLPAWPPQPPPRSARSHRLDSLACHRGPSAQASLLAVHPPSRAVRLVRRSPLLPVPKPACPPDQLVLQCGCRQRRRSLRFRVQSRHRARSRTH